MDEYLWGHYIDIYMEGIKWADQTETLSEHIHLGLLDGQIQPWALSRLFYKRPLMYKYIRGH